VDPTATRGAPAPHWPTVAEARDRYAVALVLHGIVALLALVFGVIFVGVDSATSRTLTAVERTTVNAEVVLIAILWFLLWTYCFRRYHTTTRGEDVGPLRTPAMISAVLTGAVGSASAGVLLVSVVGGSTPNSLGGLAIPFPGAAAVLTAGLALGLVGSGILYGATYLSIPLPVPGPSGDPVPPEWD
jgi:hypothetical protein